MHRLRRKDGGLVPQPHDGHLCTTIEQIHEGNSNNSDQDACISIETENLAEFENNTRATIVQAQGITVQSQGQENENQRRRL